MRTVAAVAIALVSITAPAFASDAGGGGSPIPVDGVQGAVLAGEPDINASILADGIGSFLVVGDPQHGVLSRVPADGIGGVVIAGDGVGGTPVEGEGPGGYALSLSTADGEPDTGVFLAGDGIGTVSIPGEGGGINGPTPGEGGGGLCYSGAGQVV